MGMECFKWDAEQELGKLTSLPGNWSEDHVRIFGFFTTVTTLPAAVPIISTLELRKITLET